MTRSSICLFILILWTVPSFAADEKDEGDKIAEFCTQLRQNKEIAEAIVLAAKTDSVHRRNMAKGMELYQNRCHTALLRRATGLDAGDNPVKQ